MRESSNPLKCLDPRFRGDDKTFIRRLLQTHQYFTHKNICELTNPDGTMARGPEIRRFSERHRMPVLTVENLVAYRGGLQQQAG